MEQVAEVVPMEEEEALTRLLRLHRGVRSVLRAEAIHRHLEEEEVAVIHQQVPVEAFHRLEVCRAGGTSLPTASRRSISSTT